MHDLRIEEVGRTQSGWDGPGMYAWCVCGLWTMMVRHLRHSDVTQRFVEEHLEDVAQEASKRRTQPPPFWTGFVSPSQPITISQPISSNPTITTPDPIDPDTPQ